METDEVRLAREVAVARAQEFWKQEVSERRPRSTDPIAQASGFDTRVGEHEWCGMFVAACYFHAGLDRALRSGFWHTKNVVAYFTYDYGSRVPRWVWSADAGWCKVKAMHEKRGSLRRWLDRDALQKGDLASLDIQAGDVALVDHDRDGNPNHITLVERYDAAAGLLVTLEGNAIGKVPAGINVDGTILEGDAKGPSVVRNRRDLNDPKQRAKIVGVGRPSAVDFTPQHYSKNDLRPADDPMPVRVAAAQAQTRALDAGGPADAPPPETTPRKWNLPPEQPPHWLDAAAEVKEETGTRPAPRGPFALAAMEACLALNCSPRQAAGITANSINETGWGRHYTAYNCGGWKIYESYVRSFKQRNPGQSPRWSRAPGNRTSGDPPWCYYRAFESFQAYFTEWVEKFVPQPDTAPGARYEATGNAFWTGGDWFAALIAAGYKGPVTKANPAPSLLEHKSLEVTVLRMWVQSKIGAEVDGRWGPESRRLLTAWQASHGVVDPGSREGEFSDVTLDALADPGAAARDLGLEECAGVGEGWPEWALDALPEEPEAAGDDALDVLVDALRTRGSADRRALARKVLALLLDDA